MTPPLVVSLPHRLGRIEATRRLKDGLATVSSQFGAFFVIEEEIWSGDRLSFTDEDNPARIGAYRPLSQLARIMQPVLTDVA
jgi:hypothetical protein